jgi:hypothetical protein
MKKLSKCRAKIETLLTLTRLPWIGKWFEINTSLQPHPNQHRKILFEIIKPIMSIAVHTANIENA